ncbi:MAG: sulfide/dihydroorotate dehydrogenase-like FAD/NAD-binding protein [Dehalococcoidia bacterium]|nr:sulfide/dihydroorotate dehydrogenase-like FAD/NAD-binding protein [Dehalococcoidia bacterium]
MHRILRKEDLTPSVHLLEIEAPAIARKAKAGQFVMVRLDEAGERIPLTLADWAPQAGSITLVFLEVGRETNMLAKLCAGDYLTDVAGPLGQPTHIEKFGTVVCVGGGVGVAAIAPIARSMNEAGNRVVSIMGARSSNLLFWEDRLKSVSHEFIVITDDGSHGRHGVVTQPLKEVLERAPGPDRVIAIGPAVMMKFCALTARPFSVKTIVSLNPIMVDGTGMCGSCRVSVAGQTRFACLDGPDFDAQDVDWDLLLNRLRTYADKEKQALEMWRRQCASAPAREGESSGHAQG